MPKLTAEALVKPMLAAAAAALRERWPQTRNYARLEFNKFAQTVLMIQASYALGELSKTEAKLLLDIQRNAMRSVLLTLEGLGLISVERAINAALKAVRDAVNAAIGFALL